MANKFEGDAPHRVLPSLSDAILMLFAYSNLVMPFSKHSTRIATVLR